MAVVMSRKKNHCREEEVLHPGMALLLPVAARTRPSPSRYRASRRWAGASSAAGSPHGARSRLERWNGSGTACAMRPVTRSPRPRKARLIALVPRRRATVEAVEDPVRGQIEVLELLAVRPLTDLGDVQPSGRAGIARPARRRNGERHAAGPRRRAAPQAVYCSGHAGPRLFLPFGGRAGRRRASGKTERRVEDG